ncbi:hypothetical protein [Nocardioides sp. URHA0020]|uniref:hypothetical protein n=1 Tax=Nocardioides sp. URHA0020 TaxID=1380392 RepID=UPI00048F9022|nr:hypothetical protein [Nocardioides sp. URHA0020]
MTTFDGRWAATVCAYCDPVFEAANVGFVRHALPAQPDDPVAAILWEADPSKFAESYPDSGIVESYGEQYWDDVSCIDYWVYVEAEENLCRLSVEGWNLHEVLVRAGGQSDFDGMAIASVFARILGIRWPLPD